MVRRGIMTGLFAVLVLGGCNLLTGVSDLVPNGEGEETSPREAGAPLPEASLPLLDASGADRIAPDASPDSTAGDAEAGARRVFVTSSTHTGAVGGVDSADAICNSLATTAGLGGKWVAWLSAKDAPAVARVGFAEGPWYLVTGDLVATKSNLAAPPLAHAIDRTELGAVPPPSEDRVWTGTVATGTPNQNDCNQWKGTLGSGHIGEARSNGASWTSLGNEPCSQVNRFYCFEL